jgi:predicted transcriptional regulator|tara:strand:- start:1252 stop:1527 length:276 start_codon:yes stop_codon:yes gene_type:complete
MSKKRDRLQVIHDILEVIRNKGNKIKPTHILYKSNLSHQMMQLYLDELIQKGFVIENQTEKGKTYSLTDKGHNYLNEYRIITNFVDSFGLS